MAYCPECGDEVAEIDSFCPHCGITLQPIEVAGDAEESLESTIVISQTEIAELRSTAETGSTATSPAKEEIAENAGLAQSGTLPESNDAAERSDAGAIEVADALEENADTDEKNASSETKIQTPGGTGEPIESADAELVENGPDSDSYAEQLTSAEKQPLKGLDPEAFGGRFMTEAEIADQQTIDGKFFDENSSIETNFQSDYFDDSAEDNEDIDSEKTSVAESALENFVNETSADKDDPVSESSVGEPQPAETDFNTGVSEIDQSEDAEESVSENVEEVVRADINSPESTPKNSKKKGAKQDGSVKSNLETGSVPEVEDQSSESVDASEASTIIHSFSHKTLPDDPDNVVNDTSSGEIALPSVPSILKPDFEFEQEDLSQGISKFDSVSIMEEKDDSTEGPSNEVLIEQPPASESEPAESVSVVTPSAPDDSDEFESEKESRSYTSPNMSGSDTDGKKSKLKPLDEGTVLNSRYEIVRKIGGGGMGAVYLASDKNLGGVLRAVKEMVQSYIEETQQEKAISDFKRESMLLTSLEHSAIPTIYDYFYDDKEARFYLVMKYINGGDLSSRLRAAPEGRVDEKSVVEWAIQVADVLDYLHRREPPIVYRDLKPANIMIDGNSGKVMLIDFGIARWINKEEKGVTAVGTMGYAPPELFSGNVEPRSDIYSLGSTMFHLLTGADPQSNPLLIFDFQKNPRPRQINPQLSDQIEGILMLSVEYNADKRFSSTAEMRRALEDHLENLNSNRITYGVKESPKAVTLSDEKVFCGFCGQSIVASDLFCAFCGAKQPIAQKGVHSESYSSVPVTAKLTIIGTNELDSPSYTIDKDENLVGRRDPMSNIFPEIDLSKYDPQTKISRRHARIWRDGNKFLVEDLGSSNGTILMPVVNEAYRLAPNKPQILTNGDRLKLGDTTLHFVIG